MSAKLTPMQTMIDWCIKNAFNVESQAGDKIIAIDYEEMKKQFDGLLEKEKQDIIQSFEIGYNMGYKDNGKTGEDYFTETFKQPK